jgi:putative DNA primase/helicase
VFEGHQDLIPFLQTYVGYTLTGLTKEEYLLVLYGEGRNGKGTLIKTLDGLFGDYATTADFNTFVDKGDNSRGPRDNVADMKGKRFVASQETREGAKLAEALVKWLTGGDKIAARHLFERRFEFQPTHKIWLATNHKPEITGDDVGIWSRIKLIPFTICFWGREDTSLKQALTDELPGILRWAVEGCQTYLRDGLVFPEAVLAATAEYQTESDQIARWIQDCCVLVEGHQKRAYELHANYEKWCLRTHEKTVLNTKAFGRRLKKRKELKSEHDRNGTVYLGIGLKAEGYDAQEEA